MTGTAGFVLLLFVLGGEDDDASPEDTVLTLFESAKNGDCEAVVELVTGDFWETDGSSGALQECEGYVADETPGWVDNYTVKEVMLQSQEASTATVGVRLAPEPGADTPPEWIASLVQDDDTWLVEAVEVSDLSQPPESTSEGTEGSETASDAPARPEPPPTGGGPELDRLAVECYQGDMAACDGLFDATFDEAQEYGTTSRPHTEYGASCGGRFTGEVTEYCEDLIPDSNG